MAVVPSYVSVPVTAADSHPDATNYAQQADLRVWDAVANKWRAIAAGTNGQHMTADSTQPLGVKWA
jgi:gamma-glutamyl:cysteine ligase YbdK (ATP-grasp superfamily)